MSNSMMVGLNGLEPSTSPLSGVRSNHLSYRPLSSNALLYYHVLFLLSIYFCLFYKIMRNTQNALSEKDFCLIKRACVLFCIVVKVAWYSDKQMFSLYKSNKMRCFIKKDAHAPFLNDHPSSNIAANAVGKASISRELSSLQDILIPLRTHSAVI